MTRYYFAGAEIPKWRALLTNEGVRHIAISFVGLSRRVKFKRPWYLADKFGPETEILVDSGAYSIRSNPGKYADDDLVELRRKYLAFVEANLWRASVIVDWDVPGFTLPELPDLAGDKFLPVWHAEDQIPRLHELAERYGRVGVPVTDLNGRDIVPVLRSLARDGIRLHGVGMTKPRVLEMLPWDSVSSTSWLSPALYGETIVWTGKQLKWYGKNESDQGRKRHRQHFINVGFDPALIESGDKTELLRVSLWSWQKYLTHQRGVLATMTPEEASRDYAEFEPETPTNSGEETGKRLVGIRRRAAHKITPGFEVSEIEEREIGEDGNFVTKRRRYLNVVDESQRICDTCFLRVSCEEFKPGYTCAYSLPVEIRTVEQRRRIKEMVAEIQYKRVAEMWRAEQQEGGYADPNLTREIKVLTEILESLDEDETERLAINVTARSRAAGEATLIGRLFGEKASEAAQALPAPIPADDVLREMGIVDAEVIKES